MWRYTVTDESGREHILTFHHEPTQAEIRARIKEDIWSSGKSWGEQAVEKPAAFFTGLAKGTVSAGADIYSLIGGSSRLAAKGLRGLGIDGVANDLQRTGKWFDEGSKAAAGWERGIGEWVGETMPDAEGASSNA